jgi:hypothetical protein
MKTEKCIIPNCNKESFSQVEVPITSITESGKILFPYNSKESEVNTFLPMCAYHMVLQSEFGIVMLNSDKTLILRCPEILEKYKNCPDKEMIESIKEQKDDPNKSKGIELAKIHLKAKKFEEDLEKKE